MFQALDTCPVVELWVAHIVGYATSKTENKIQSCCPCKNKHKHVTIELVIIIMVDIRDQCCDDSWYSILILRYVHTHIRRRFSSRYNCHHSNLPTG